MCKSFSLVIWTSFALHTCAYITLRAWRLYSVLRHGFCGMKFGGSLEWLMRDELHALWETTAYLGRHFDMNATLCVGRNVFLQRVMFCSTICFVIVRIRYLDVFNAPHQHATTTANLPTSPYSSQVPAYQPFTNRQVFAWTRRVFLSRPAVMRSSWHHQGPPLFHHHRWAVKLAVCKKPL